MPISLAKIASNVASLTLSVGEDTVTIEYYPGRITEKLIMQLQVFQKMQSVEMSDDAIFKGFTDFNETFCKLVKSWDVYEDEAQTLMFPLDPERITEFPLFFRMQIVGAIISDMRPNEIAPQG